MLSCSTLTEYFTWNVLFAENVLVFRQDVELVLYDNI